MRLHGLWVAVCLWVVTVGATVTGGEISSTLQARLDSAKVGETVTVWLRPAQAADIGDVKARGQAAYHSRRERYRAVATDLKESARNSQRDLKSELESLEATSRVRNVKYHWLVNIVEAEIEVSALRELVARPDIEAVLEPPEVRLIAPARETLGGEVDDARAGVSENLKFIRADEVWAAGYTGKGRLVCTFDTGVEGDHPALAGGWKGNDGDHEAAWFDTHMGGEDLPHVIEDCGQASCNSSHGTHVLGTIVGHDDTSGDTIGVAPGAQWISAAVVDITGASIIDAFEWAVNPDGDLNSIDDVPDVINHSWGVVGVGCENIFYDLIEATEALAIVNIFAAGNDGPGTLTMRNPANRALDALDCFAVGNVDADNAVPVIHATSSRGPSECNGAIKPNVCAPGGAIRSCVPGGYGFMTGTSMAAAQVSGLVALMRERNPEVSVDEIKEAILLTAPDFGYALPNNDYGWGVIDCMAAINAVAPPSAHPHLRIYTFDCENGEPGDTMFGSLVLQNLGEAVTSVSVSVLEPPPEVDVISGTATFGTIAGGDTARAQNTLAFAVSLAVTAGTVIPLDVEVVGVGYIDTVVLYVPVAPTADRSLVTHEAGRVTFSLSNFGSFGLGPGSTFPLGGEGFRFDGSENCLHEGGLMIGVGPTMVSDAVTNFIGEPDGDFRVVSGGSFELNVSPDGAAEHSLARFSDQRAENPIGLEITQESFAFAVSPDDRLIILRYIISADEGRDVGDIYAGLYLDWDIVSWFQNAGGYELADRFLWTAYNNGSSLEHYRGVALLEGNLSSAMTAEGMMVYFTDDGFSEEEKYASLHDGLVSAQVYKQAQHDLVQVLAVGPFNLARGESDTVAFAIIAGDSYDDINAVAEAARLAYINLEDCCRLRGDVNHDGGSVQDIADVVWMVQYMFQGGPPPPCFDEGDINGDGGSVMDIADLTYLIEYMFASGPPPPECP